MPLHDTRVDAALAWTRRSCGSATTVENAPGPAEERRFGRRLAVVAAAIVVLVVGGVVGERALGHRNAVPVVGSWVLTGIDRDGRPTVSAADLDAYERGVPLEFDDDGTFVMAGRCAATTGDYDVSWDDLTLRNDGAAAVGCGYTDADAEHRAMLVADGVGSALDAGTVTVSRPDADRLALSVDDGRYVLHYDRSPA